MDDDFKDDSDSKLIKLFFKQTKTNIPDNIQKLICLDHLFFEKIYKWLKESNYLDELSEKISYSSNTDKYEWEETEIALINKNKQSIKSIKSIKLIKLINYIYYCENWLFGNSITNHIV